MKTTIQELIHFIENDRMQFTYTKEQILELLNFKLKKEKEQIIDAFFEGKNDGILMERYSDYKHITPDEYYNETFKSE